ncbi:hypothetical protein SAMN05216312_104310 [Cohnella sp. OV330]|uniref:hypothetical protein n=1 Tax=Cohnella sp. OV330 TaxID=1855288 RepID=UPI0008E54C03|nr:hypothetical protein [Cohnella sp. OV330]SFB18748.1 hypothetical protein SAMN05216312_104310 [Cohnella sp. OV330]
MKMATFVIGGIVGAALTVAIRRSPKLSVAAGMLGRELKNRSFGMKEGAIGKMFDMRFGSDHVERRGEQANESLKRTASRNSDRDSLGEIASIVSKDPGVREDVNEILAESGQHRI